ncbi:hypothetical protein U8C35_06355 [Sinorhizobium medicae]|uniref:hypothetical protein n=1 Tax=Sinorhizobium medicae TaxID=110321 RepID=UPI002AF6CBD6|nr:hypothetical protein [Sinorhizobium medicae]WQO60054.1 hypothetical protein U8C35_06355 [Sinorhizobium medicae]
MNTEMTYNPVKALTPLDMISDWFWKKRITASIMLGSFAFGAFMAAAALFSL